jgi:DNA-binding Lrp family transcriptional regulator
MAKLDDLDRQLLDAVQADAGRTAERISEVVPLSPSAVQRRRTALSTPW